MTLTQDNLAAPPNDGATGTDQQDLLASRSRPLCVDLDGTLLRTDLLAESILALLRRNIFFVFLLPLWLLRGKAYLKAQIAKRVTIDARKLPYSATFLDFLRQEKARGRKLILATAAHERQAQAVVDHLHLFDDVLASTDTTNLSGSAKLACLNDAYGAGNYDYAGNARPDITIFQSGAGIVVVNASAFVRRAARKAGPILHEFNDQPFQVQTYVKALRPHQWLKNVLVFVPLLLSQIFTLTVLGQGITAFIAFGLCASSVYVLNDLLDLPDDRAHHSKKHRPFASGAIPLLHGVIMAPILLAAAFAIASQLPLAFVGVLAAYYLTTLAYSVFLKRVMLVDVITLAGLFTLRIVAGTAVFELPRSSWLLAFSMFLFFSLALVKRYVELREMAKENDTLIPFSSRSRGYRRDDLEALSQFGISSGLIAVLVLALYIDTTVVKELYSKPELLWFVCPLMLYLVTRIWILARRGEMHDDPVEFAIRDWRSQLVLSLSVLVVILSAVV